MTRPWTDRLEAAARNLLEGTIYRLVGRPITVDDIAAACITALDGRAEASLTVRLNPADLADLSRRQPGPAGAVKQQLPGAVALVLTADDAVARGALPVEVALPPDAQPSTQAYARSAAAAVAVTALQRLDAFLIIDGRQHVPLDAPSITLGRHVDNDVVLASTDVSRRHALIRWRYGRFILLDLNSRAGSYVNDHKVTECALHPGDVVRLASHTLIYGEGDTVARRPGPHAPGLDQTQQLPPTPRDP